MFTFFRCCSIKSLENHRAAHGRQFNVISVRKGLRRWVPKSFLNFIINKEKLLDFMGEVKNENDAHIEVEAVKRLKSTLGSIMPIPIQNRKVKKSRKKRKAKAPDDTFSPIIQQVSSPVNDLVSGTFGRLVSLCRWELPGQEFGRGWRETEIKTEPQLVKSAPSFKVDMTTIQVTEQDYARMTSADLYPETDEDSYGEVNGIPQAQSTKSIGSTKKTKDQCSRKTKKPTAQDNVTEPRVAKPKPPETKTAKAEVVITTSEKEDEKQCRNQKDDDQGTSACSFCGKRSNALKTCSGCKKSKYCDKVCQSKDYQTHKIQGNKDQRCQNAVKMADICTTDESVDPSSLIFKQMEVGRAHQWLFLEIVESNFIIYGFGVVTVDLAGRDIFLTVILPPDFLFEKVDERTGVVTVVTLETCLRPGNYLLVFEPNCVAFVSGIPTIEINPLEKFSFVFASPPSTSS